MMYLDDLEEKGVRFPLMMENYTDLTIKRL